MKEGCFLPVLDYRMAGGAYGTAATFSKEALHMLMLGNKLPSASALTLSTTKMMEVLEEEKAGKTAGGKEKTDDETRGDKEKAGEFSGGKEKAGGTGNGEGKKDLPGGKESERAGSGTSETDPRYEDAEDELTQEADEGRKAEDGVAGNSFMFDAQAGFGGLALDGTGSEVPGDLAGMFLAGQQMGGGLIPLPPRQAIGGAVAGGAISKVGAGKGKDELGKETRSTERP